MFSKRTEINLFCKEKLPQFLIQMPKCLLFFRGVVVWERKMVNNFPLAKRFLKENNMKFQEEIQKTIQGHLEALKDCWTQLSNSSRGEN